VEAHEVRGREHAPAFEAPGDALEEDDHLVPARAERLNEAASARQLHRQRRRHAGVRGRDEDRVERLVGGKPIASVSDDEPDVPGAVSFERRLRPLREVGEALDAPDGARELGEQRRLKAVAGADLEHTLSAGEPERLDHARDERRLCRDLPVGNRDRDVEVGLVDALRRDEEGARDAQKGVEDALVFDAFGNKRANEVGLPGRTRTRP
jgi:hypothetical protein